MSKNSPIAAFDLGTVNSVVSVIVNGEVVIVPNDLGNYTTPSVVAFNKKGEKLVGQLAKRQQVLSPENTFSHFKRLMGHTYEEVKDEIASYKIKPDAQGRAVVYCPNVDKDFTPEELSGFVLSYLKEAAENFIGQPIDRCIITVPAYFGNAARESTRISATLAQMTCERIVNEPTAAALAYGESKKFSGNILVYDLGGGTMDVSILNSEGDDLYEVLASSGNHQLGGKDFDDRIVQYLVSEFKKDTGVDLSKDPGSLQRVTEAAEKAKCELSSQLTTNINIPYITSVDQNPLHLNIDLSRNKFESLISDLLERVKAPIKEVLKDIDKSQIKEILLVGGSTRVPAVVKLAEDLVGIKSSKGANVDLVVSEGAGVLAKTLQGEGSIVLVDVTPLSLGIEVQGGLHHILVPKNTTIPTSKKEIFSTATDNQTSVDIVIAQGERAMSRDNKILGNFQLTDIPAARKGIPQIEVEISLDANGILSVKAVDLGTKKENKITITQSSNLSKEEIERMVEDAEKYAKQDADAKELIISKNELESLISNLRTTISESKDKVDESLITPVNEAIVKAEEALNSNDKETINKAKEDLLTSSHALSAKLYENIQEVQPEVVEVEPEVVG